MIDVGGGSLNNSTRYSLARMSLRWMIRECLTETGIMFDSQRLRLLDLDPTTLHPFVTPRPPALSVDSAMMIRAGIPKPPVKQKLVSAFHRRTLPSHTPVPKDEAHANALVKEYWPIGTEEEEEPWDALSPIYDQLRVGLLPMTEEYSVARRLAFPGRAPHPTSTERLRKRNIRTFRRLI
ncbi:hypothetical protein EDD18DRAFT_1289898 [Armillaria luteobubalina]|uniref:Uncharacterized protein n=1 Tax=Armillaria luteobubalina TaxID=153913 RepID=A0AA39Q091_9AGAR|nr:hypothetical protein EDD18DRAFT_1289898 [Armillaria luteobubalina]